jgi:nucleotide-binding universal stress UspA family protein
VNVSEHVVSGDPAFALTDVAQHERARLIAIGAGERRPAVRRVIGSVADAVAARAPCAVLIVRPSGA